MEDVSNVKISNFKADTPSLNVPIIEINEGNDILISESYGWKYHPVFISISENSKNIKLLNNDFSNFENIIENDHTDRIKLISNLYNK